MPKRFLVTASFHVPSSAAGVAPVTFVTYVPGSPTEAAAAVAASPATSAASTSTLLIAPPSRRPAHAERSTVRRPRLALGQRVPEHAEEVAVRDRVEPLSVVPALPQSRHERGIVLRPGEAVEAHAAAAELQRLGHDVDERLPQL